MHHCRDGGPSAQYCCRFVQPGRALLGQGAGFVFGVAGLQGRLLSQHRPVQTAVDHDRRDGRHLARTRSASRADIDVEAVGETLGALIPGSYVLELFLGPTRIADGVKALIDNAAPRPDRQPEDPGPSPATMGPT